MKSSPEDFDFIKNSTDMQSNLASVGKELQQISDNAIQNLKDKINAAYTADSKLHEHNANFVQKKMILHQNILKGDQKLFEELSNKVESIHLDADLKASLQKEIRKVKTEIQKYSDDHDAISEKSEIALNLAARQHENIRNANEKKRIHKDESDAKRYLEVEGNLLKKESYALRVLELDQLCLRQVFKV